MRRPQDDMSPLLTRDELERIRAKLAGDTVDALDIEALLYHADAVTDRYEDLVQRHGQEADRSQELVSELEARLITVERQRDYLIEQLHAAERGERVARVIGDVS